MSIATADKVIQEITLPLPPSVNSYWTLARGRLIISTDGKMYRLVATTLMRQKRIRRISGRVAVEVTLYPPDKRRRDLDNILKCLLDSLKYGGAYDDDSQIDFLVVRRGSVIPPGSVRVVIYERL